MLLTEKDREELRVVHPWLMVSDNFISWVVSFSASYDKETGLLHFNDDKAPWIKTKFKGKISISLEENDVPMVFSDEENWLWLAQYVFWRNNQCWLWTPHALNFYRDKSFMKFFNEMIIPFFIQAWYHRDTWERLWGVLTPWKRGILEYHFHRLVNFFRQAFKYPIRRK